MTATHVPTVDVTPAVAPGLLGGAFRPGGRRRAPSRGWEAVSLAGKPVPGPVVELTATEATEVQQLARLIMADPVVDPTGFAVQAAAAGQHLPVRILHLLRRFRENGNQAGFLVFRGVPTGQGDPAWPVPPTPLSNEHAVGSRTLLAREMALFGSAPGTDLISYQAEGCGRLLQDMVPNPNLVHAQESQGSGVELEAHTEQAFSPLRPDLLLLAALRDDPAAHTYVCTVAELLSHLTDEEAARLREPWWITTIDSSFRPYVPDPDQVRGPWPILSGPEHDPRILIDQDLQRGLTPDAERLRRRVIDLYIQHRGRHTLIAGDVLLLDNQRAMHGRSPFTARFDGTDRFIVRGFATRDLDRSAHARPAGSRQIQAVYS